MLRIERSPGSSRRWRLTMRRGLLYIQDCAGTDAVRIRALLQRLRLMQQTRSSRVHRRDIMNNAPKTLIKFTTPSPDNARAPGAKASSTRKPRARRKFAASRATHSENAAHNPYSRGGIRNMLLPPFNCSSVEQGIAIDARISTTMARDFHGDLETAAFSVRSGSDSVVAVPARRPLFGQCAATLH